MSGIYLAQTLGSQTNKFLCTTMNYTGGESKFRDITHTFTTTSPMQDIPEDAQWLHITPKVTAAVLQNMCYTQM